MEIQIEPRMVIKLKNNSRAYVISFYEEKEIFVNVYTKNRIEKTFKASQIDVKGTYKLNNTNLSDFNALANNTEFSLEILFYFLENNIKLPKNEKS